jgi:hypothetical protein
VSALAKGSGARGPALGRNERVGPRSNCCRTALRALPSSLHKQPPPAIRSYILVDPWSGSGAPLEPETQSDPTRTGADALPAQPVPVRRIVIEPSDTCGCDGGRCHRTGCKSEVAVWLVHPGPFALSGDTAPPSSGFDIAHHESAAGLWITKQTALQRPPESDAILTRVFTRLALGPSARRLPPRRRVFFANAGRRAPGRRKRDASRFAHARTCVGPIRSAAAEMGLERRDQTPASPSRGCDFWCPRSCL